MRGELPGLARACEVLAAGGAVVVPNPTPMTYGLVATGAAVINAAKRRPPEQAVAVCLHNSSEWGRLAPGFDLSPGALEDVLALLRKRVSVLLPLRSDVPHLEWVAPAVQDGYLAAFNAYWDVTARIWERFPRLYGSSANISGSPPAASAAQARAMFGEDVPVIDADALRAAGSTSSASTMVRIDRAGRVHPYRAGAQDAEVAATTPQD